MSRRTHRSRLPLTALAVAMAAALAGCGSPAPVAGAGFPDPDAVQRNDEARFEVQMELLGDAILQADPFVGDVGTDVAGVAYLHATFGEHTLDTQTFVAIQGSPPAVFYQQTDAEPGATLDLVHQAGSDYDYFLLGDQFASLAPTQWVQLPTAYKPYTNYVLGHLCGIPGFFQACDLHNMINITIESGEDVRRLVSVDEDGTVHSQTQITLQAMLDDGGILSFGDDIIESFPDSMFEARIPVDFWQDADGNLLKMEMNGVFEGDATSGDLLIQSGFEVTGQGSAVEVPALPPDWDVTIIEADQVSAFWDQVWELK